MPLVRRCEIRRHIIPQYKRVVELVHLHNKPFLLHSCGKIYDVMDDPINEVGNFGGIEMNILTLNTPDEVRAYVRELLPKIEGHGGIAIGTGNQISDYIEPANWIAMTDAVREWRGD